MFNYTNLNAHATKAMPDACVCVFNLVMFAYLSGKCEGNIWTSSSSSSSPLTPHPLGLLHSEIGAAGRPSVGSNRALNPSSHESFYKQRQQLGKEKKKVLERNYGGDSTLDGQWRKGRAPGLSCWCSPHPCTSFPRALRHTDDVTVSWQTELGLLRFARFSPLINFSQWYSLYILSFLFVCCLF